MHLSSRGRHSRNIYIPRFSLRFLFAIVTIVAVVIGLWQQLYVKYESQRNVMLQITNLGGKHWSYETVPDGPKWLRKKFGEDNFRNVIAVHLGDTPFSDRDANLLKQLPYLERLSLGDANLSDEKLTELKQANPQLTISAAPFTPKGKRIAVTTTTHMASIVKYFYLPVMIIGAVVGVVAYRHRVSKLKRQSLVWN